MQKYSIKKQALLEVIKLKFITRRAF